MDGMNTRLSRKAQEEAAALSGSFDQAVRERAALLAQAAGREFADETDVREAFRLIVLKYSAAVGGAVQGS
jgi:histone H3/H4